jgi:hypothetical protein
MNAPLFSLTAMALGVMVGIAGTHFQQVQTMVEQADGTQHGAPIDVAPIDGRSDRGFALVKSPGTVATVEVQALSHASNLVTESKNSDQRVDPLVEILDEMRSEQKRMRQQLAETNRDLAEANFRLDSHSDSFKPLTPDVERPSSLGTPISPLGGDAGPDHSLLPPKP